MLEITRFTPRICYVERIVVETIRNKFTKTNVIKKLMKEQKECFGALLETKSQKAKRLKREKKGIIASKNLELDGDSELSWVTKNSKIRYIRTKRDPSVTPPVPAEKVVLVKSSKKHEQASFEAAEGVLMKLQKGTPSEINKEIAKTLPAVQKRIIRKTPKVSRLENVTESPEESIIVQPEDIIKNIEEASLFHEEEENYEDIWHSNKILSVSPMESKEYLVYPSVTRILNATMSDKAKQMLEQWMAKMIEELGQEGFDKYKADLLNNGKLLHSAIDNTLRKMPFEVPVNLKLCFESVKDVLDEVKDVRAIESHVIHRDLGYRGIVDCVASYKGNFYLIDWKKSNRTKEFLSSTYDAPLQIASYIGALNADKNYPFQIKSGLLVIAYTIGNKPTLHRIDKTKLQYYWNLWLVRLKKYYAM